MGENLTAGNVAPVICYLGTEWK